MKLFKLNIYRGNELVYSNVYNDNITLVCYNIFSFSKNSPSKLFVLVRQMYFNSFGELRPKMYKGNFNYSLCCLVDKNTSYKLIRSFLERSKPNLIDHEDFTNE